MHIDITGHHMDITDALKSYVNEKMQRLERHFDHVTNPHVVLSVEKLQHKAEATIQFNGSKVFADSVQDDMYAAIDTLIDKLDRQVKKHKEKNTDERHRSPKPSRMSAA